MTAKKRCPFKPNLLCEATPQLREESDCIGCLQYDPYAPTVEGTNIRRLEPNISTPISTPSSTDSEPHFFVSILEGTNVSSNLAGEVARSQAE